MASAKASGHARSSSWVDKYAKEQTERAAVFTGPNGVWATVQRNLVSSPLRRKWLIRAAVVAALVLFFSPFYKAPEQQVERYRPPPRTSSSQDDGSFVVRIPVAPDGAVDMVDPLIGTAGKGHVFPGATLPFGMTKAGPDVTGERFGGFSLDGSPISGFSHFHDNGVRSAPSLGNFPIFVHPSCPNDKTILCSVAKIERAQGYDQGSLQASPGYFSVKLASGVEAEMSVSPRAALYRFSFSDKTTSPLVILDASDLNLTPGQRVLKADKSGARIVGSGLFTPSFGQGAYTAYVCTDLRLRGLDDSLQVPTVREVGTFDGSHHLGKTSTEGFGNKGHQHAAYIRLDNLRPSDKLLVRVGVSWTGVQQACKNADQVDHWDFDRVVDEAREAWDAKLTAITLHDPSRVSRSLRRNFWSGVYRSLISPQDYTGENQLGWAGNEPYFDSFYCLRDTFRGVHPLITLLDPDAQINMVRSLLETYRHEGWLPECRMSFCKGYVEGGSHAGNLIVDTMVKLGKVPQVNWTTAYHAILNLTEFQPRNWDVNGRGGHEFYKKLGFIPWKAGVPGGSNTRSISRTLEYAYNDYAVAAMALINRKLELYTRLFAVAMNWKHMFKPDEESLGIKGPFPQPRYADGKHWHYQDPTLCSPLNDPDACNYLRSDHETYQGSSWLYSFYAPGDMAGLISLMGGREAFLKRLDTLHDSGVLDISLPIAFLTPSLYHYAGRPGLSAERIHSYIPKHFHDGRDGLPGSDAGGSLGAFVAWNMMGLVPVAGQNVYLINIPFFPGFSVKNPMTEKVATINVIGFDEDYHNKYIQYATLNGEAYTKNWLDHTFFRDGGTLELFVGPRESDWGTESKDLPPSLSTTGIHLSEMP